jgi:hypothetical protein
MVTRIPEYRLPRALIDRETEAIVSLGSTSNSGVALDATSPSTNCSIGTTPCSSVSEPVVARPQHPRA